MGNNQSWSIIVFCFNEVNTVASVIEAAHQFSKRVNPSAFEIIVVDDGSTDGSRDVIRQQEAKYPEMRVVFHEVNRGIGEALRSGYFAARYENMVAVPADGQFDLTELDPYASFNANNFISFFRLENTIYSFTRNILSYINKIINRLLLGIKLHDVNWVKVYKRESVIPLQLQLRSSLIESEICSKLILKKNTPIETASVYHPRRSGQSKGASGKIVLQALKETARLVWVIIKYRFTS